VAPSRGCRCRAARAGGRLVLAVDVSAWLRPDAATSDQRLFCHVYGRGQNQAQLIPGWPYSIIAALEPGRTSWTAILDALRLGPADDVAEVTATQVRDVVLRLITAGQWTPGDPDVLVVFDAGYDVTRLAFLLADLPVQVLGRPPAPPRLSTAIGRPPKHGGEFRLADPTTWPAAAVATSTDTRRYGTARAGARDHVHPRLTRRAAWINHDGDLPVLHGTLARLEVDHLPGERDPKPVWLWSSRTGAAPDDVDRLRQAFLRRFDLEHTFRLFKQTLGWTAPRLRDPAAAGRWTCLVITAHTQLRLARHLTTDLRRPWERPATHARLTPARVRRGFRNLRPKTSHPAGAPKPSAPGDQFGSDMLGHRPADDSAGVGVHHGGAVQLALLSGVLGDVGDPQPVRSVHSEPTIDRVGGRLGVWVAHGCSRAGAADTGPGRRPGASAGPPF
jgi:hypothetical protein